MARRALVTGARGFVGRYLVAALTQRGWEVVGTSQQPGDRSMRELDVTNSRSADALVSEVSPDAIVQLAGVTYLPEVMEAPERALRVNVFGTLNMLDAAARRAPRCRFLAVSSGAVFGTPMPPDLPLGEGAPRRAIHPYGLQKVAVELLAERARQNQELDVIVARPFNHIGPGLDPRISVAHFAAQIAAAEAGASAPILKVGNLAARRDFLDVRDVVRAYVLLLDHPNPPPLVNVASGHSHSIGEALEFLRAQSRVPLTIESDPARFRSLDAPELVGDATLLRQSTSWVPLIPFQESLTAILDHARRMRVGTSLPHHEAR